MFLVMLLYIVCASTFTISKAALAYVHPIFFCAIRLLLAGALVLGYHEWATHQKIAIKKKDVLLFLGVMIFQSFISYVADLWALQFMSSIAAAFIYNLSPFISAIFSYFQFHERFTIKKTIGLIIGFAAMIPVFMAENPAESALKIVSFFSVPELVMLIAVAAAAYGWILLRELVKNRGYAIAQVNGMSMLGGGALSLLASFLTEPWHPVPVVAWQPFILYTLLMVLIAHIIYFNLYGYLLHYYTATFLSFAGFTCPLWAALFGWLFLGEAIAWQFFVAALAILVGLYLFYQEELRQGYSTHE